MTIIPGYVPSIGEKDLEKISRAIRNLYENTPDTMREKLTANRTYYVRTDGSNSNDGLTNTATGAFLTRQKAWDTIVDTLDLRGFTVEVQLADGTYTDGMFSSKAVIGGNGPDSVIFRGNATTPANVIISTTGSHCFGAGYGDGVGLSQFYVKDMELRTTTAGSCLSAEGGGCAIHFENIRFGACANNHMTVSHGGWIAAFGNFRVTGDAQICIAAASLGICVVHGMTVTYENDPAFSIANVVANQGSQVFMQVMTFVDDAGVTGTRYSVSTGAGIHTGGGASYIPGDAAGAGSSGVSTGYYV